MTRYPAFRAIAEMRSVPPRRSESIGAALILAILVFMLLVGGEW